MDPRANGRKRVLFVDDDPGILETLGRMVHVSGEKWDAQYVLSVDAALAVLASTDIDVVVADIRMPHRDGIELLRTMRADASLGNIPVIVLTGEADHTLKRRVLEIGAADLLNKPVSSEDLIARLRNTLRMKDYQDRLENQVDILDGLVKERTVQLERAQRQIAWRLAKAGEFRDDQTGNHVARVALYSHVLAEGMGMACDFVDMLLQTSPLHDIGKIGVPDSILLKPGPLDPEERRVIERHAVVGQDILKRAPRSVLMLSDVNLPIHGVSGEEECPPLLQMASAIARHHHEKWNGTGYPDKLAGDAIPVAARIVALADVYDALRSKRPYKLPFSEPEALAIIRNEINRHFDPDIVETFFDHQDRIKEIQHRLQSSEDEALGGAQSYEEHFVCG